jgi:hypothetical protein
VSDSLPLSYQIDRDRRLVRVLYRAQPAFLEWAAVMRTIFQESAFCRGFGILLDRRVVHEAPSVPYIRQMVNFIETEGAAAGADRWTLLVASEESFGVGRMAQGWASTEMIGVFTEAGEAEAWLAHEGPPA